MNYYQHHIGDFNNATRHLTRVERSIYSDMLDLYYDTEKPMTLDFDLLCRKVIARTDEERTAVQQALNEFFIETDAGWYQERCEQVIADYHANTGQKAAAGRASAAKRAAKRQQAINGNPTDVERALNERATNQEPITNNQEEPIGKTKAANRRTKLPDEFYPDQTGIDKATVSGIAISAELERFKDFHRGKGNVMADWQAAWRTWVGNAVKFAKGSNNGNSRDEDRKRTIRNLTGYDADAIPSVSTRIG